ncbi:MAG: hypothetical protein HYV51_01875 [Parcubacteria group bacterium]|nr:hypothetical protein [Parcubacteria group bacterium]
MSKTEKIGKPSMKDPESGADRELGQPVFDREFEKESIEATFPVVKEAISEFYEKYFSRGKQINRTLQIIRDAERTCGIAIEILKKEDGDATLALSIIESARGELQYERDLMESHKLESEEEVKNQEAEIVWQKNFEKDLHYQEASDILFSHDEYGVPEKPDFIEWLGETKESIKKLAKEEEEKFRGAQEGDGIGKRPFRSRLLTDVPAIERFEIGKETTRDYREIMDVLNSRLLAERERLGVLLLQYGENSERVFYDKMAKTLVGVRQMELFLAMAEGERNERIAKKQLY